VRHLRLTVAFALFVAVLAFAQNPATPDLSGTWVLNHKKSKHSGVRHETVVIRRSGAEITMKFVSDGKPSIKTLFADGQIHPWSMQEHDQATSQSYWKDSVLVAETMVISSAIPRYPVFRYQERWSLSSDGRTLTREIVGSPGQVLVYDKQ
jgi:hypothetical protein